MAGNYGFCGECRTAIINGPQKVTIARGEPIILNLVGQVASKSAMVPAGTNSHSCAADPDETLARRQLFILDLEVELLMVSAIRVVHFCCFCSLHTDCSLHCFTDLRAR